ncbi:MAG: NAD(P)H-dependent oxidoreductase subunit E [Chloroflexota bacterium]|nr:NAD(P)H-dependent oxidoreductase subunit E [Chloroflexota bacterium]
MEQSSPSVVGQIASDPALENGAHPTGDAIDLAEVRQILAQFHYRDFQEAQELILSALQEINEHYGWVSLPAAEVVAAHFGTTASRIYGLLTFYADFRTEPRGKHFMLLCHGMACYVMGSQRLIQHLEDDWGVADAGTTADGELTVQVVNGCLGVCDRAPICKLDADYIGDLTAEKLNDAIRTAIAGGGSWRDVHHPVVTGSFHDR